jgi:hypothetical protein
MDTHQNERFDGSVCQITNFKYVVAVEAIFFYDIMEVIEEFGIWETYDELATLPRKRSLHTNLTPKRKSKLF